jgi:hypothetical protein
MVALNLDLNGAMPRYGSDGGGLPPGKHKVVIEDTQIVPVKDNSGNQYLQIKMKCIDGLAQGGYQIDRLNVHNSNPQTVAIANGQVAAYCWVTGKQWRGETFDLHNVPFYIEVRNQRNNADFTEVAKLYNLAGEEPGKGAQPQAAAQQQPQGFGAPGMQAPQQAWAPPAAAAPAPAQQFAPQPDPGAGQWQQPQQAAPTQAAPWSPGGQPNAPSWGPR